MAGRDADDLAGMARVGNEPLTVSTSTGRGHSFPLHNAHSTLVNVLVDNLGGLRVLLHDKDMGRALVLLASAEHLELDFALPVPCPSCSSQSSISPRYSCDVCESVVLGFVSSLIVSASFRAFSTQSFMATP